MLDTDNAEERSIRKLATKHQVKRKRAVYCYGTGDFYFALP